jgi:hypothetical protein
MRLKLDKQVQGKALETPEEAAARARGEEIRDMVLLAQIREQVQLREDLAASVRRQFPEVAAKHDTEGFRTLAIEFLDATREMLERRISGTNHHEWSKLEQKLPTELRQPFLEMRSAREAACEARWQHEQAAQGTWCGDIIVVAERSAAEAKRTLEERLLAALERLQQATEAMKAVASQRSDAERQLLADWVLELSPAYREFHAHFHKRCAKHETELCSLNRHGFRFHEWKATSACALLLNIADDTVRLLSRSDSGDDYLQIAKLEKKLAGLGRDAWEELDIALRAELAALVHSRTNGASPAGVGVVHPQMADLPILPRPATQRGNNTVVDAVALDLLRTAWEGPQPHCPTWMDLANGVVAQLARDGRTMKVSTALQAVKQRCPRTRERMTEIHAELEGRRVQAADRARTGRRQPKRKRR